MKGTILMRKIILTLAAIAAVGTAAVAPADARGFGRGAAIGAGIAAGAVGATAAGVAYNNGYGYGYAPDYGYAPADGYYADPGYYYDDPYDYGYSNYNYGTSYHCRWVRAHWEGGYWIRAHRACWYY